LRKLGLGGENACTAGISVRKLELGGKNARTAGISLRKLGLGGESVRGIDGVLGREVVRRAAGDPQSVDKRDELVAVIVGTHEHSTTGSGNTAGRWRRAGVSASTTRSNRGSAAIGTILC
jgi:hypothetical protein